ncbi:MAG: amidophosphoribosyltransferase [Eubacteriales bacterium]
MFMDKPGEECGVIGAFDASGGDVAKLIYYGMYALQHRGQESCGIAVNLNKETSVVRAMGLVSDSGFSDKLSALHGAHGVGHLRYSTHGESNIDNAQPLVVRYKKGNLAVVHNGNLTNVDQLKDELAQNGAIFRTTTDSEVITYLIARARLKTERVEHAIANVMEQIHGSYSLIVMSPQKLIAARDPYGYRPLCIGKKDETYFFASETCALDAVGASFIRNVEPGEVVVADVHGLHSVKPGNREKAGICVFEYIYFARSDSVIDGISVYDFRVRAGKRLAQKSKVEADLVIGVPDSGMDAAAGYSIASGIPYGKGFVKNNYVGRTFIQPSQSERVEKVKIKLNVLREAVRGKSVVMVDDSIVRGTTCANIVHMLKEAGATKVHVAISAPTFLYPCYYGTDIPSREELTAVHNTVEQMRDKLGADSLTFLDVDDLREIMGCTGFCSGCFSGTYPDGGKCE